MRLVTTTLARSPCATFAIGTAHAQPKKPQATASDMEFEAEKRGLDPAVEDARARDQALRQEGLLLGVDRAQEGARRRERRRREEQAARRVLHGQDALPDGLLRRLARLLRQDRPGRRRAHLSRRRAQVARRAVARAARDVRHPREDRHLRAARARRSVARVGARTSCYFLLGRHYYRRGGDGDFDKAIACSSRSSRNSEFFIKAKFFEGVTYVRKYEGKPAVDAFKEILDHRRGAPEAVHGRRHRQLQRARAAADGARVLLDAAVRHVDQVLREARRRTRPTGPSRCSRRRGRTS